MQTDINILYHLFLNCSGGVSTDSRKIIPNSIFFALGGSNFNGNTYALQALDNGASFAVVDDPSLDGKDERIFVVEDSLLALQNLARHHREVLGIPVIGITGTNGKTTTKELVAAILSTTYNLLYTQGNLNNHIGVPLTLLRMTQEHQLALIEMGASKRGDISELCAIAQPNYGLITNIGEAHLQGFGSLEGVRKTKGELYEWLRMHQGKAFVCAEDQTLRNMLTDIPYVLYGTTEEALIQGANTSGDNPILSLSWKIPVLGIDGQKVQTKLVGAYNLSNVLASIAVGAFFDVPVEKISTALETYTPTISRSQLIHTSLGNEVISDAYNANPTSMRIAIQNFLDIQTVLPKLLILGDMNELGENSEALHRAIYTLISEAKLSNHLEVYYCGPIWSKLNTEDTHTFPNVESLNLYLEAHQPKNTYILVKGSNSIGLSKTIDQLQTTK